MYLSFSNPFFWLYFFLFLPAVFVSFYIPGWIVLSRFKLESRTLNFVLSNALGVALWGFQGYIFGYLNIRFATYLYCGISLVLFIMNYKLFSKEFIGLMKGFDRRHFFPAILIFFGVIGQLLPIFGSGIKYSDGVKFFGNNAVDGVMHLAYIRSISAHFPPLEPGFAGLLIHNYHYWGDLVEADMSRIWTLPIIHLFFQFFPFYLSVLIGITSFVLVKEWGGSSKMALWFIFLLYFASDSAYMVLLILGKPFGFYTPAIDSGVTQFLNMPHMFGKLIFLAGLITVRKWLETKRKSWGILSVLLCSSLFGFKIYFGLYIAIGFISVFLGKLSYESFKKKSLVLDGQYFMQILLFFLLGVAIFLPHNYGAGGFVFVYLEWPRSLLGVGSIDWREWWLRRQVYEAAHNIRNLAVLDSLAVFIAFVSIYGTRLLGFVMTKKLFKFLGFRMILILIPPLVVFHILGLFTIQSSGGVNVYNFFSVSAVILSLFAAYILSMYKKNLVGMIIIILFVGLTIPRSLYEISGNIGKYVSSDYYPVSNGELEAFRYIRNNAERQTVVQGSPDNPLDIQTPYVSFFTERPSYLAGGGLLETHNVKVKDRKKALEKIFASTNVIDYSSGLRKLGVSYVYLQKKPEQMLKFNIDPTYLKTVYENQTAVVLKVQ